MPLYGVGVRLVGTVRVDVDLVSLLGEEVVLDREREVDIHGLVVQLVLHRALALVEGGANILSLRIAGRVGNLRLQLGLERAANSRPRDVREREGGSVRVCVEGSGRKAYRLASVRSSARASAHEPNSAGETETSVFEKSRTLICKTQAPDMFE